MRALGIALAACSVAVLYPSTARADAIREKVGVASCALDVHESAGAVHQSDQPWSGTLVAARHGEGLDEDDDATFDRRGSLEQSALFATEGSGTVFSDDRSTFSDQISTEGMGLAQQLTVALRQDHGAEGHEGEGHNVEAHDQGRHLGETHGLKLGRQQDPAASSTPEPASLLLIGTGLAGLFGYRKQLFG
jgi:hypothetical protein